jgi:uncharacterized protein (DUF779 family)
LELKQNGGDADGGSPSCHHRAGAIIHAERIVQADAAWDASLSFLQLEHRDIVDAVVIYFADVQYSIGTSL